MGCGSSKATGSQNKAANKAEADRWQRRKKNGFRDSGLERHRQACVNQKKKLKHVEDPKSKKKKAQQTNVNSPQQRQQKAKQVKGATATGATGLTADQLKQTRAGLKHHS